MYEKKFSVEQLKNIEIVKMKVILHIYVLGTGTPAIL